ncbi:hypothetical protein N510_002012 [Firmicutes bacterium ASF500]|nr:hypothetical protein N510_002012 [Firmicutes bacterium ASF500]
MVDKVTTLTMDEIITGLGDIRATVEGKGQEICQAAVNILFALSEEGAKTSEDALDILHDYRLQAKQITSLRSKHMVAGKPFLKDGVRSLPRRWSREVPSPTA